MNHNEVKAFFKKRLEKAINEKVILLSIDESITRRIMYLANKNTLDTIMVINTYFATSQFSIKAFDIKRIGKTKKYNEYVDYTFEISGTYRELEKLQLAIDTIKTILKI